MAHLDDLAGLRSSSRPVPLPPDLDFAPLSAPAARGAIDELLVVDPRSVVRQRTSAPAAHAGDRLVLSGWAAHEGDPGADLVAVLDGTRRHPVTQQMSGPTSRPPGSARPGPASWRPSPSKG